jgi:hypothetical protein
MWLKDASGDLVNLKRADYIYSIYIEEGEHAKVSGFYICARVGGSKAIRLSRALNEADAEKVMKWIESIISDEPIPDLHTAALDKTSTQHGLQTAVPTQRSK